VVDRPAQPRANHQRRPGPCSGRRRILRTHVLRSTWHFVLPADLRWLLMLIGPRVRARMASYYWQNGLTEAVFARSQAVLRQALARARHAEGFSLVVEPERRAGPARVELGLPRVSISIHPCRSDRRLRSHARQCLALATSRVGKGCTEALVEGPISEIIWAYPGVHW
jgi:Winged helix DNA-binding domain